MFEDPRNNQIIFLSLFLILGLSTRDWTLQPMAIALIFLVCIATQTAALTIKTRLNPVAITTNNLNQSNHFSLSSYRSATITALGLSLLLRSDHYYVLAIASVAAIASKFVFCHSAKHWFNPANFGIIVALSLTHTAWVSPGQWGDDWWYGVLFLGTGGLILKRVGRWDTSATFFCTYATLEGWRYWWLGWSWDVWWHQLTSGSLLLFTLFMLSDPRSIPNARWGRIVWTVAIAIFSFVFKEYFYWSNNIFWALFLLSPLTILIDRIWYAPRFEWQTVQKTTL